MNNEETMTRPGGGDKPSIPDEKKDELRDALVKAITGFCKNGDSVAIPGFGTFVAEKHDEEIVNDQVTGQRLLLPPSIDMKFKASVVLKKRFVG